MSTCLMLEGLVSKLERILRNFFWEEHKGSKINHLVIWETVPRDLVDGGLGLGGSKARNLALLAKWGWRYLEEEDSLWCKVVRSIHGKKNFKWHTAGKEGKCLRSPWVSISRSWLKIDALATFRLGNGRWIAF